MTVSANTPERLIVDGGTLTVGGVDIGAIEESVTFTVEREYYSPRFIGVMGDLMESVFVMRETPMLECTVSEFQIAKLGWALPGVSLSSDSSSETMTSSPGAISTGAYSDVVFTTKKADGKSLIITIRNAIARSELAIDFSDTETSKYTVQFVGHYSTSEPDTAPWSIVNYV
jgi:hypothetical protein